MAKNPLNPEDKDQPPPGLDPKELDQFDVVAERRRLDEQSRADAGLPPVEEIKDPDQGQASRPAAASASSGAPMERILAELQRTNELLEKLVEYIASE